MLSCRGARKLSSYLGRAKVYSLKPKIGSCRYGKKRCQVCLNVTETDSFTITSSSETRLFICEILVKNIVHLLTCWVCLKLYVNQR